MSQRASLTQPGRRVIILPMTELIDAIQLTAELRQNASLRVLDVRWDLGAPDGRPDYEAGHIPGAVFVDLDTELSTHTSPLDGRSPMPTEATLQAAARRWGLRNGDDVVVYDDANGVVAGRALWLLRHAGVARVRLLNGGLAAWKAAALPLESGASPVDGGGDIDLSYGALTVLDLDGVAAFPGHGVLLDARPLDKFTGENETLEPRGGHIPGAISAPASENFTTAGTFKARAELAAHYEQLGVTQGRPVAVYCGGGTSCSANFVALTALGYDVAIFPGSWSQWSAHAELPVATGPTPAGVMAGGSAAV